MNLRLQSGYQSILNGQLETRLCLCHDVFQKDVREQSTDSCRESLSHLVFKEHDTVHIVAVNLDHKLSASCHIRHDRSLSEINKVVEQVMLGANKFLKKPPHGGSDAQVIEGDSAKLGWSCAQPLWLSGDHMWHAPLHGLISVPTSNPPHALALKYATLNALTCQNALMHIGPCNL